MADEARLLEHPVPPAMNSVRGVTRQQLTVFGKGQKERVIPLRGRIVMTLRTYLGEPLGFVGRRPEPDNSSKSRTRMPAELGTSDAAVQQHEQGEAIAWRPRATEEQLVDVGGKERRRLPRRPRPPDLGSR